MGDAEIVNRQAPTLAVIGLAASIAWIVYTLIDRLETVGRHFVLLGLLRIALLGVLLTFASLSGAATRGLGKTGLVVAGIAVGANLIGAIAAVAMDGFDFDPFSEGGTQRSDSELWYAYVIGMSSFLFAVGTTLVGIAGRSTPLLRVSAILAGVLYIAAIPLGAVGHYLWIAPWIVLAAGLIGLMPTGSKRDDVPGARIDAA